MPSPPPSKGHDHIECGRWEDIRKQRRGKRNHQGWKRRQARKKSDETDADGKVTEILRGKKYEPRHVCPENEAQIRIILEKQKLTSL